MKAKIINNTQTIDYPFIKIPKDTIVEIVGTETEEGSIVIRYNGCHCLIRVADLEVNEHDRNKI